MNKAAFALGLTAVFTFSTALSAEPKVNETLCIATLKPQQNLTECEYRMPKIHHFPLRDGRILHFNGASSLKGAPMKGLDAKLCDAHFEEKKQLHGPCRKIVW